MGLEKIPAVADLTLPEYITSRLDAPFIWGRNDCVLFAMRWVQIATGRDELVRIAPWFSMRQAQRIVHELGGLQAAMDRRFQRIARNAAVDGDIAFHQNALRLYSGCHICGPGESGLIFFDRSEARCAWRCS